MEISRFLVGEFTHREFRRDRESADLSPSPTHPNSSQNGLQDRLDHYVQSVHLEMEKALLPPSTPKGKDRNGRTDQEREVSFTERVDTNGQLSRPDLSVNLAHRTNGVNRQRGMDPLVINFDGQGPIFNRLQRDTFDLNGDGGAESLDHLQPGSAYLAYDRNGNGIIDHGGELFGDQNGEDNGFEELKKIDDHRDGILDSRDRHFSDLLLFRPGEKPLPLGAAKIHSIPLKYRSNPGENPILEGNNRPLAEGYALRQDGTQVGIRDYLLDTVG